MCGVKALAGFHTTHVSLLVKQRTEFLRCLTKGPHVANTNSYVV